MYSSTWCSDVPVIQIRCTTQTMHIQKSSLFWSICLWWRANRLQLGWLSNIHGTVVQPRERERERDARSAKLRERVATTSRNAKDPLPKTAHPKVAVFNSRLGARISGERTMLFYDPGPTHATRLLVLGRRDTTRGTSTDAYDQAKQHRPYNRRPQRVRLFMTENEQFFWISHTIFIW